MGLIFIPFYIKYLGIEAYGLLGIFALLQGWLVLLDMGMTPAVGREMALFTGGGHNAQSIRDLLRSIEIVGFGIAVLVGLGIWFASDWLVSDWLRVGKLPIDDVAQAVAIMGVTISLRFIENIYRSSIAGLQRQVSLNVLSSVMATLRGFGAIGILAWVSPTIDAFFIWQGLISIITVVLFAIVVYRTLTATHQSARFSLPALIGIWRFAAGMMVLTFLSILLTQVDKILLSRLLTLEAFGYYVLATTVVNVLGSINGPICYAIYPRMIELVAKTDNTGLISIYHSGAQFVTVLMGTAAVLLMVSGDVVMTLWTTDSVARQTAPLVAVLAMGTLLNGLMAIPVHMLIAHGRTSLIVKFNVFAVAIIVPAIFWVTPKYGAIGAAWLWVILNTGHVTIAIHFIHRQLLPSEKWRWYRQDVAFPLIVTIATALVLRWVTPNNLGTIAQLVILLASAILAVTAASLSAPAVRHQLVRHFRLLRRIKLFVGTQYGTE